MDDRVISLISCLGPFMSAAQNQMLSDVGRELYQLRAELAAAQATIAQMRETLELTCPPDCKDGMTDSGGSQPWGEPILIPCQACSARTAALALPTNQDALHEALARECERLKGFADINSDHDTAAWLEHEAAIHRARKEQK